MPTRGRGMPVAICADDWLARVPPPCRQLWQGRVRAWEVVMGSTIECGRRHGGRSIEGSWLRNGSDWKMGLGELAQQGIRMIRIR